MSVPELLSDLSIHYNAFIRKVAATFNLTASQAFHLISIPYDGIPMSGLSKKLGLDTSTLTRNIQKLESLGLVKRTRYIYDKRILKIFLTADGAQIVEGLDKKLSDINQSLVESLDIDSQENLLEALECLVWSMDCLREAK